MKEYDDQTLHHVQQCELGILKDVVEICEEHGLTYFGLAGTGIGAMRHQGFIPWDDDIDIGMPTRDLDTLIEIIQQQYADKYTVMNADINLEYPLATTRIMLKGTEFCEEALSKLPLDLGIFLDMYAFDNVADDEKAYRKQVWDAWFWAHIRILLSIPDPVIQMSGWKGTVMKAACLAAAGAFKFFRVSKKWVYRREKEARTRYARQKTQRIGYLCDTNRFTQTYAWKDIVPLSRVQFEGMELCFPKEIDSMLRDMFGDYMQLPPLEKRKNHFPARLDFGPY
ncbi:LicD family protein [Schaalia sp. lx-260]|uniref:LicD family protein n=1 Tax=Schaalia sp. lx-260 TaxID=2899082 RepID=UPI001E5F3B92|nr:LicD family protein [Schaalia sp. lx-260]MCD4550326.1 LicD family protein [Schaalia sp. lx-260]